MSLLLTRHVDKYRIDLRCGGPGGLRPDNLRATRLEPLADQFAVKPITLDDQYALHRGRPP
jgi:hypothetical protein